MLYVFIASTSLFVCSFLFRVMEESYGFHPFFTTRKSLNTWFVRVRGRVVDVFQNGYDYTHRELVARVLHSCMYGTLFVTRRIERWLENGMMWMRSLRRKSRARRIERAKHRAQQEGGSV